MAIRVMIASFLMLAMAGCASNVVTDYDSAAVFGNYSSWAFTDELGEGQSVVSLDGSRIRNAVERELNRKAMKKVSADEADLLVAWKIVEEERLESYGVGFGLGFGHSPFGWGLASAPPVREIQEGKLVIELADTNTQRVVWRAASRRYLNEDQSPEYRRELIDEVVAEMFSKYPPGLDQGSGGY
ncbi:DUF4136 domain-containing protein [Marinobacter sp. NP-4(2019)]|uniref:DUF4136 domain-containing protein n=1 Tax=Marinobacter sp. NP-4(2019) TaxID=2488665 RepID=UPI000FC3C9D5|nr:DUF4136 domain-containing protein [Marinobacter sp. NP-4(2019)]AZT84729.1 DUF4136 domain-containing protein [Marinobacter sp. NP-4(2019)]